MAAGTPVIALREGGAAESVTEKTGVFFYPQSTESLIEAVQKIESNSVKISEVDCRDRAASFSRERFQKELIDLIRREWTRTGRPELNLER